MKNNLDQNKLAYSSIWIKKVAYDELLLLANAEKKTAYVTKEAMINCELVKLINQNLLFDKKWWLSFLNNISSVTFIEQ